MARRGGAKLITIYWRDIPAQVNAGSGDSKHQVLLKPRFQKAIDRAAMVAGITSASDYVNEWRQAASPLEREASVAADELATEIDESFPLERLNDLVANGGYEVDNPLATAAQLGSDGETQ